jgi:hypothetical protein
VQGTPAESFAAVVLSDRMQLLASMRYAWKFRDIHTAK